MFWWILDSKETFTNYKNRRKIKDGKSEIERKNDAEFFAICTRIESIIFAQQYEGATTGVYNANIVARKLGLTEKRDIMTNGKEINRLEKVKIELPEGVSLHKVEDVEAIDVTDREHLQIKKKI